MDLSTSVVRLSRSAYMFGADRNSQQLFFPDYAPRISQLTSSFQVTGATGPFTISTVETRQTPTNSTTLIPTDWLQLSATSGSGPIPTTINLTTSVSNLANSAYYATITVTTIEIVKLVPTQVKATLSVYLYVDGANVIAAPSPLSFTALEGQKASQALNVTLDYPEIVSIIATSSGWLSLHTTSQPGTGFSFTVTADASAYSSPMPALQGTLTIMCMPTNQCIPQPVPVTFVVTAPPPILSVNTVTLAPISIQAGGSGGASFSINNSGGSTGKFQVNASSTGGWLSAGPSVGSIPANGSQTINVKADASTLAAGTYSGTVTASGDGGFSKSLTLTLTVTAKPTLVISANPISYSYQSGGGPSCGNTFFNIGSSNSAPLAVTVSSSVTTPSGGTWLKASAPSPTPSTLTVSCDPAGLSAGTYTGQVLVFGLAQSGRDDFGLFGGHSSSSNHRARAAEPYCSGAFANSNHKFDHH